MSNNLPTVICHMMSSLDGKITFGKVKGKEVEVSAFTDYMDLYNLTQEKLNANAWMCGRITMDEYDDENKFSIDDFKSLIDNSKEDFIIKNNLNKYAIGIDTKGLLRWSKNYINIGAKNNENDKYYLIMIVTSKTPPEYLSFLRSKNIAYVFGGDREVDFRKTFRILKEKFAIETLLLEGGGNINGSVIAQNLINEISLLLMPFVINNVEAPELFYRQLDEAKIYNFKLTDLERLQKDVLWLRYKSNFT